MARASWKVTIGQNLGEGRFVLSGGRSTDASVKTAAAVALQAALDAAQLAAVAKGAGDASVEITATGVAIAAYEAAVNAADTVAMAGDVVISINTTNITTINQLKRALGEVLRQAQGDGILLP